MSPAMHASRDIGQPTDNSNFENDEKSELPSQLRTGSVTVLDLASSSPPDNFNSGWRFYASFTSLCIITLAVALDATSLSVALPIISESLHGSAIAAFWCGTSFLLSSTAFQPTFASLSYILGRKPLLLVALLFFTVGAIVGALAQNFTSLLVGRSIQGVGGGGIISLTEILITDLVPLRERGKWFGFQSLTWALGSVTGPLIGGAFAQEATWRWIFWINLPFCGLGFLTLPYCLRLHHPPGRLASKILRFDWVGAILLTASTTSFLMPVSWGGVMFAWSSFRTLVPFILGICGLLVFVMYEIYVAKTPLIPLRIFSNRTAAVNCFGTLVHGMLLWCLLYYLPLYYEAVKGYSPIIVGVAVFPETFTVAPASILVGIAVSITGRFRWAIWSGWSLTVLGMGLLFLLGPETSVPAFVFLNLIPGLGLGLLFASMNLAIQAAATERNVGYAAAIYIFMRSLGQSVGVAVGGVIFQSEFAVELRGYPDLARNATALAQDASGLVQVIKAMPEGAAERTAVVYAYADALKVVWAVMAGLAFVALLLALGTKGLSLNAKMETEQALRERENDQRLR
ncbi:hypothetical protein HO133_010329 [Letharia lupina]|uniref:Major facilitator superfamily (MFS) profile domain-containing protein n=1 Tax=Letharia lupina TaxID=560253 RepID=A0A8H6CKC6_9LECA|nr:uncharacterized protein HO133_010329 [Letharia lupina]KAF6225133.1 hypothetical protein HO133_010329 [Letharia lupina]